MSPAQVFVFCLYRLPSSHVAVCVNSFHSVIELVSCTNSSYGRPKNCEVRAFSLSSRVAVFLVLLIGACTYVYSFLWHTSVSRPSGSSLMLRSRTVGVSSRCGLYWNTLGLWERRATATVSAIIVGTYSPSYLLFILPAPSAPDSVAQCHTT